MYFALKLQTKLPLNTAVYFFYKSAVQQGKSAEQFQIDMIFKFHYDAA